MFKRVTWLGVGFTLGVGSTVVAARKARRQLDRYKANAVVDRVATTVGGKASTFRDQVTAALDEGRVAAREREDELRAERPRLVHATSTVASVDELGARRSR
jgi:predicted RNA-binding Zn ribbon-like protein